MGEFGLIDLLAKMAGGEKNEHLLIGIGDDAAAWKSDATIQLATVDSFIEGVHFPSGIASWQELGWKAMATNLSDIAAMGGLPRYALVTLALPEDTEVDDVTAFYKGMLDLAQQYGVIIVGGDVSRAPVVAITITILGSTKDGDKNMLTRSTAKPGEQVAVTGYLGAAAAGLEMLQKKLKFDPPAAARFKQAFLYPYPRIAEGQLLLEQGVKTAIDISDGLISDLNHISKASKVSARVEVERVPIEPMVKEGFDEKRALELALSGGEDYELLLTAGAEVIDRVKKTASCPITVIGEIAAGKGVTVVDRQGKPIDVGQAGWEHFTTK